MLEIIKSFFSPVGGGGEQASLHRMEIYKGRRICVKVETLLAIPTSIEREVKSI